MHSQDWRSAASWLGSPPRMGSVLDDYGPNFTSAQSPIAPQRRIAWQRPHTQSRTYIPRAAPDREQAPGRIDSGMRRALEHGMSGPAAVRAPRSPPRFGLARVRSATIRRLRPCDATGIGDLARPFRAQERATLPTAGSRSSPGRSACARPGTYGTHAGALLGLERPVRQHGPRGATWPRPSWSRTQQ